MSQAASPPPDLSGDGRLAPHPDDPARTETFIPARCVQNHAANLTLLPNGDLCCVWFGGTQEGVPDISVQFSRLAKGSDRWTPPETLSDDPARSEQNPLLFPAPDGTLWLIWTAQISGNQDTAIVRCRKSGDHGHSWGSIETLFGPRDGEGGTFMRQPMVVLSNGDWLLPIWVCVTTPGRKWVGDEDYSAVKISSDQGRTWSEYAVPDSKGCVHMSVLDMQDGALVAFYRSRWADNVYVSRSTDLGRTWSAPARTELPNNNSSIQAARLANGHVAMVFNESSAADAKERRTSLYDDIEGEEGDTRAEPTPVEGVRSTFWGVPRAPMTLAISEDGGRTWPRRRNLETGDGYCMTNNSRDKVNREFSYPTVTQSPDGALHVAYTYYRQAIKHVRVDESWVGAGA